MKQLSSAMPSPRPICSGIISSEPRAWSTKSCVTGGELVWRPPRSNPFKPIDHEHHIPPRLTLAINPKGSRAMKHRLGPDRPLRVGNLPGHHDVRRPGCVVEG